MVALLFVIVIYRGLPVNAALFTAHPDVQFTARANVFEVGRFDDNVTSPGALDTETARASPCPEYVCIGVVWTRGEMLLLPSAMLLPVIKSLKQHCPPGVRLKVLVQAATPPQAVPVVT